MLRTLYLQKEKLRGAMAALWEKRQKGESWTPEEAKAYEKHTADARSLNDQIEKRAEFCELFQAQKTAEGRELSKLEDQASIFNLLKRQIFEATGDSRFKIDGGPQREVLAERRKKADDTLLETGGDPVPLSAFGAHERASQGLQKRATIDTSAGNAGDLVQDTIKPEIVPNLYEKAWCGRAGCEFIENWRGNFLIPKEDTKPASGFIAETAAYPESSIDFDDAVNLKPLKVGALQPFSLQSFMQDQTRMLQASINRQLMAEWAKKSRWRLHER